MSNPGCKVCGSAARALLGTEGRGRGGALLDEARVARKEEGLEAAKAIEGSILGAQLRAAQQLVKHNAR